MKVSDALYDYAMRAYRFVKPPNEIVAELQALVQDMKTPTVPYLVIDLVHQRIEVLILEIAKELTDDRINELELLIRFIDEQGEKIILGTYRATSAKQKNLDVLPNSTKLLLDGLVKRD